MTANHQRRINIVGGPGSGKTTLSRILAEQLGLQRIELDAMNHMAGWKEKDRDLFRAELATALEVDGWVVDGNYAAKGQDLVWETADTVIWLDLPRRVVFPALIARTVRRGLHREVLWNGNVERPLQLLDPRPNENILLWAITRFQVYRERYSAAMTDPANHRICFLRLVSRADVDRLIRGLPDLPNGPTHDDGQQQDPGERAG